VVGIPICVINTRVDVISTSYSRKVCTSVDKIC